MTPTPLCPVCFTHPRQADAGKCRDCDPRNVGKTPGQPEEDNR